MANSNAVIRKRPGRPRTEEFPVVSFRLDPTWRQDIDEWRSGEPGNLSRSDAFRLLMMRGLSAAYDEREQATQRLAPALAPRRAIGKRPHGARYANASESN